MRMVVGLNYYGAGIFQNSVFLKASSLVPEIIIHNLLIWHLSKLLLNKSVFLFMGLFCLSNVQEIDIEKTVEKKNREEWTQDLTGLEPTVGPYKHKV